MFIPLLIIAIVVLWLVFSYNGLVTLRTRSDEAWSDIEVQMKRRYDLIPNLVKTVQGYAAHESGAFEKVTQARAQAMQAGSLAQKGAAENMLTSALKSVFAIAEAYPELKANQNFLALQTELSDTENKIQAARRFYNGNTRDYNIRIDSFPSNLVAKMGHFVKKEFFQLEAGEQAAKNPVEVNF